MALELSFACKVESLSVRAFSVHEAASSPFEARVVARSPDEDLDLEDFVEQPASLRITGDGNGAPRSRLFAGVCSEMEMVAVEPNGLSTYSIVIVPSLSLLGHRTNHRIFQHESIPSIVDKMLEEWKLPREWHIEKDAYPKLETRVQYGESDLDFVNRLLEEAGITYWFSESKIILHDSAHSASERDGGPLPHFVEADHGRTIDHIFAARVAQRVKPSKFLFRDHDFRKHASFKLDGAAQATGGTHSLEEYLYRPGTFLVEHAETGPWKALATATKLAGDDHGMARFSDKAGALLARRKLEAARAARRGVTFFTNALDIAPGNVLSIANHARTDLSAKDRLLVTESWLEGTEAGDTKLRHHAVFAGEPFRPAHKTVKPSVKGLQSAVVVGPSGDEIHTDEHGRVRVQFHWDREGEYSDRSSCWMRVAQSWAGAGYGLIALPRVGQEVLVGFLEGDPDHPVVVGRLFNESAKAPHGLPEHKTRSSWKTSSSPGGGGSNEITLEDAKGSELFYVHAEKNLEKVVESDEVEVTGGDRSVRVAKGRVTEIHGEDTSTIGARYEVRMAPLSATEAGRVTRIEMIDRRIRLGTDEASITLDGPNITIAAKGLITIRSSHDDVLLLGGPLVKINCKAGPEVPIERSDWKEYRLVDHEQKAVANARCRVTLPDGGTVEHVTDAEGRIRLDGIAAGNCRIELLSLGDAE